MFGPRFFGARFFGPRYWGVGAAAVTDPLVIDGLVYQVEADSYDEDHEPWVPSERSVHSELLSGVSTARGHHVGRAIRTGWMAMADAVTRETALRAPGRRSVSGTLIGSTLNHYAVGVEREDGPSLQYARLSFTLIQV